MEKQITFSVRFNQADVVSAHRLRYLHSPRLRLLAGIGLLGLVYLLVQVAAPGLLPGGSDLTLPAGVAAIGLGTPLFAYLAAPVYDFRANPVWRQEFTVLMNAEKVTVRVAGRPAGYALTWKSLTRILENARVLVLIFGRETDFLILPKPALGKAGRVEEIKKLARRHAPKLKGKPA